jgi:SAM-dependent methyltransferase
LEINEAGSLSPTLRQLPGCTSSSYPEIDMQALPFVDGRFDLVIHSDTLEHVQFPVRALAECCRVLRTNGWLCFTVPTVVGRLTRSRVGLPKSFHGDPAASRDDFLVYTEYGADMWISVFEAGFTAVTIHAVDFPSALALSARKP